MVREPFSGERPKADAHRHRPAGHSGRRVVGRLRPGAFCRSAGARRRRGHAGWKGAFTGVLENTISAMEGLGAKRENIVAVLGPSISAKNYEVGPEFVDRFVDADADNSRYFEPSPNAGHALFDLNLYTVDRLEGRRRNRRCARPLHLCRGGPFLFLPPHHASLARRITGGRFPRLYWRIFDGAAF